MAFALHEHNSNLVLLLNPWLTCNINRAEPYKWFHIYQYCLVQGHVIHNLLYSLFRICYLSLYTQSKCWLLTPGFFHIQWNEVIIFVYVSKIYLLCVQLIKFLVICYILLICYIRPDIDSKGKQILLTHRRWPPPDDARHLIIFNDKGWDVFSYSKASLLWAFSELQ